MIAVIPARGNSKGLHRKNLLPVAGKPLLLHVLETLRQVPAVERIIVSTEDPEIASVGQIHGAEIIHRPRELAEDDVTVGEVAQHVCAQLDYEGPLLVVQPTCPLITAATFGELCRAVAGGSHDGWTLATPIDHLVRTWDEPLTKRVNRQQLDADLYREVGVRGFTAPLFVDQFPTGMLLIDRDEALDIDTVADLQTADQTLSRKRILFRVTGSKIKGSGHLRRCLTLAEQLQHHLCLFQTVDSERWVEDEIQSRGWMFGIDGDLIVNDILDTQPSDVLPFLAEGSKVLNLEDLGPGARYADAVVNSLYPAGIRGERTGVEWAVLRSEFLALPRFQVVENASRILAVFGGTDPSQFGDRLRKWSSLDIQTVEPGESVAAAMTQADLLITSAGRTVYEAAAVGIPTIVVAQNQREATHTHLGPSHGNIYLGLGRLVPDDQIMWTVQIVLADFDLRTEMSLKARASIDGKGTLRTTNLIDSLLKGLAP
jgi:CMP-N-acetylneuraminic acid synthetase/spore coat polysaccharide biosynthesis predicted glycosyltransferase SpsG